MRSDQMFANVCAYAQHEIVRQKVLTASMHKIVKKDDSREMPEIASKRHSFIGEFFTHSGGVLLALVSFRHSSQSCSNICRFRKQADVLATTTPESKKFQIEATL